MGTARGPKGESMGKGLLVAAASASEAEYVGSQHPYWSASYSRSSPFSWKSCVYAGRTAGGGVGEEGSEDRMEAVGESGGKRLDPDENEVVDEAGDGMGVSVSIGVGGKEEHELGERWLRILISSGMQV